LLLVCVSACRNRAKALQVARKISTDPFISDRCRLREFFPSIIGHRDIPAKRRRISRQISCGSLSLSLSLSRARAREAFSLAAAAPFPAFREQYRQSAFSDVDFAIAQSALARLAYIMLPDRGGDPRRRNSVETLHAIYCRYRAVY